ncbi:MULTISPECIES: Bro-N domain-containing protein [unclassified Novosphingobium]|uniref:BRO-N domain-containing protein n=1 Tax=unclassified Novosphingobium TaxID=2644732 RepID=UPI000D31631A|nr:MULTISPECIES: Bro-N domain-containing protein [unclassified Novosphingobium]PTR07911.1 BRO family protein [Novosphingobium sp. GV055]PUB00724.1 BRO family protein [Novosphingobium sp. GV061]PUB16133.1 BRO family protein [Novosphingobium sp. GV079]PUB39598.1 BRO family protein [Novosphingobium sp. GV027]
MSNALLSYQFDETPVRIAIIDDDPWFVASDLSSVLGYSQPAFMTRILDDDEKGLHIMQTLGGQQQMLIVSESGMYAAVLKSRKPEAKRFRKWVTAEVLPSLRKTGRYELPGLDEAPVQALDFDPIRLSAGANVVRLAMRLYGPVAARRLWPQLGLPAVTPDGESVIDADPIASPLRAYLVDKQETTIQQAADGMGLVDIDWSTRQRIGKLLHLWGWTSKTRKVHRRAARVFTRPADGAIIAGSAA